MKPLLLAAQALWLLVCVLVIADARAEDIVVARGTSTSRSSTDWKGYFNSDMKKLTTHSETTTTFDRGSNPSVTVNGVAFDVAATSPIQSQSIAHSVALPTDPDFGSVDIESTSVDAKGVETKTSFTLRDRSLMVPIVVGAMEGAVVRPPVREQTIDGKKFAVSSTTRTTEIIALIVATSFQDLIDKKNLHEVSEPGTRIEKGTMRVLSASGEAIGFYAGDVRRGDIVQFVTSR